MENVKDIDGNYYEGEWLFDRINGIGLNITVDNSYYFGNWVNN